MRLKFIFSNGTPPVDFNEDVGHSIPLELDVPSRSTVAKRNAQDMYIKSLDYLFRGVSNYASGNITGITVEKGWFGKIEKNNDSIHWDAISDKNYVVIYDLSRQAITENMYVADAISIDGDKSFKGVDPIWIKELLTPNANGMKENIIASIEIATEYLKGYRLAWGFMGKEGLSILDQNNNIIDAEDIESDETFILVKLLTLLMSKGTHMGVFLVNCEGISDNVIDAFTKTAKIFFGDAYIFLYNVPLHSKVERKVVTLPNFLETRG